MKITSNLTKKEIMEVKGLQVPVAPEDKLYKISSKIKMARLYFWVLGNLRPRLAAKVAWSIFQKPRYRAQHKHTDDLIENAETFTFLHNGQSIKAYSWGEGVRTILLIHGWESRGTALRAFVPHFIEKGYRVVTFDGPAHGNSTGKRLNILSFAGLIQHITEELGDVSTIIAHSFGGFSTGYLLARLYTNIKLDSLVLLGAPTKMEVALDFYFDYLKIPQKVLPHITRRIRNETGVYPKDVDIRTVPKPKNIKKVLLVHDVNDEMVPFENATILAEKWKDTTLLKTEGFGHIKILKAPEVIKKIVDFVD